MTPGGARLLSASLEFDVGVEESRTSWGSRKM